MQSWFYTILCLTHGLLLRKKHHTDQIVNVLVIAGKHRAKIIFQKRNFSSSQGFCFCFVFWCFAIYYMLARAKAKTGDVLSVISIIFNKSWMNKLNRSTSIYSQSCHLKISFILAKKVYRLVLNTIHAKLRSLSILTHLL